MAKHCTFRSADRCGFLESNLSPCPSCPFRAVVVSLEEILVRIHGEQGPPGPTGTVGQEGAKGVPGAQGDTGPGGSNGARGLPGLKGEGLRGLPGPGGDEGAKGDRGDRGEKGDKGDEGKTDEEKLKALIRQLGSGGGSRGQLLLGWNRQRTLSTVAKTAAYTATSIDHLITCDASGAAFTVTLPAISGVPGITYHIKKTDSSANAVTVDGDASETIDGGTTATISTQFESMMIIAGASEWHVI